MKLRAIHGVWICVIVVAVASAQSPTYNLIYSFKGSPDGAGPSATLIHDAAGNFYGTTFAGGAYGYGSIFKIATSGQETVLYSFTASTDGANPLGPLWRDQNGNLYGTRRRAAQVPAVADVEWFTN